MPRTIPAVNLVNVTRQDLGSLALNRGEFGPEVTIEYKVRTDTGETHHHGRYVVTLSGAERSALLDWIEDFLPDINTQEGM